MGRNNPKAGIYFLATEADFIFPRCRYGSVALIG